ncbi:MAG TPA: IclR family transcriptional regulator C-terminal domain-containing protein [Solirubrobacteraceae bacterium]|jgi:DNA-binding IclR family transcriptional regulator|nr:IclR family transcriptional regulator C-terminal domain-containing protein [Solirubrobacteraceae bacterium]
MSKPLDPEHPGRFSSSLVAGLAMLTCFTAERPVRGIADMAEELDLGRSTTHRYATTLVTLGYLEQGPSRKYRLSSRVSDFGLSLLDSMVVRRVAREHLRELRARTGRTASLGVLGGAEVAYIDRWQGSRQGQYAVDEGIGLGTRLPIHCTAAGKALLARLPEAEQRNAIAQLRLAKRGPKTIATKTALRAELGRITDEQDGVAIEDEELLAGRRAVAAPVLDKGGRAVAAVELAVPAKAYSREELLAQMGPKVAATAERIAVALT